MKKMIISVLSFLLASSLVGCGMVVKPVSGDTPERKHNSEARMEDTQEKEEVWVSHIPTTPNPSYEPLQSDSDYGRYMDENPAKVRERKLTSKELSTAVSKSETITISYAYTYVPSNKMIALGETLDTYVDEEGAEYSYLYNTDILCGFTRWNVTREAHNFQGEPIDESTARKIAADFLAEMRKDSLTYQFLKCGAGQDGSYSITYCKPVAGYRSDNEFIVWLTTSGEIEMFVEHNYKRYDGLAVKDEDVQKAMQAIADKCAESTTVRMEMYDDPYITMTHDGKLALAQSISYLIPTENSELFASWADTLTEPIG